ncbi:MAG: 50S ribosomal protein L24e [archaeon]|nr:50S ribosomal protein L24e [archaeon]
MVKIRTCSFCGYNIQPGEGVTYIKNDGTIFDFCTNKCKKNKLDYKKNPRKTKYTKHFGKQ